MAGKLSAEDGGEASEAPDDSLGGVVGALADGIIVVDPAGKVRFANPTACALFGRSLSDLVGTDFGFPITVGSATEIELLVAGAPRVVEMRVAASRWNAEPVLVASLRDVTARATAERDAVAALRRRDQALAVVAHELANPITVFAGVTQTLQQHWDEMDDARKLDLLARAEDQAQRMQRLVDRVLSAAAIQAGNRPATPEPVDVAGVVATCVGRLGPQAADVSVKCLPGLVAYADRDHLGEILDNYLENAFKYGAPPVQVDAARVDGWVEVRVSDRGQGVPPAFAPRLFERFSRDAAASGKRGIGLGLAIVADLASGNGGEVWYEPGRNGGATFCVRMPLAEAADAS
jgi:signal transduction histidine kinase